MTYKKVLFVFITIALILMSGCTGKDAGSSQDEKTPDDKQTSPNEEQTSQATAQDTEVQEPGSVQTVHFSRLIEYLPSAPSSWTADEPQGFMYTIEKGSWSMANREYSKGDTSKASVGIMDSAFYEVGWYSAWKGIFQYESTDGYAKTTKVKGYPALETYSKDSNEYGMYVNVKERFMVYMTVQDAEKDTLDSLANAIDYAGIAALN